MVSFVLVHGAFHGGWCWDRVAPILRAAGHEVHAPSLTGSGDRAHLAELLGDRLDAELNVQDVLAVIDRHELTDVVLVGHSMGSTIVPEVGYRRPEQVRHVVCLDGATPVTGFDARAAEESARPEVMEHRARMAAAAQGGSYTTPPGDASMFDVKDPEDIAWVNRNLTPQPIGSRTLLSPPPSQPPTTYVVCTESVFYQPLSGLLSMYDNPEILELTTGHDAMVTAPLETAELLLKIAARVSA